MKLTKSQKKKVRVLIDLGLKRDYIDGVKKVKELVNSFSDYETNARENYNKLYRTVREKDKEIARRYDPLTGSRYYIILIVLLLDGVLTVEDIEDLDDELKKAILKSLEFTR
jgi:divalent metal cation (Fe/Co/Zn/Cd) transporter